MKLHISFILFVNDSYALPNVEIFARFSSLFDERLTYKY